MITKHKNRSGLRFNFSLILILLVVVFINGIGSNAYAAFAASSYSDVLEDLRTDGAFDVEDYPIIKGDYSLRVIQIAESADGELLVYVYQPGAVRQIDKLLSVKMSFTEQPVQCRYCGNMAHADGLTAGHSYKSTFGYKDLDAIPHTDYEINYRDRGGNSGGGNIVHANPYAWYRIRTTSEFLTDENNKDYNLTKGTADDVKGTQWVLSFYETQRQCKTDENDVWKAFLPLGQLFVGDMDLKYSKISDVMLLQLEFETAGQTYKLGVVDNKQTGSSTPGNEPAKSNPLEKAKTAAIAGGIAGAVIVVVVAVILICVYVPGAAPIIGKMILALLKGIWQLILLPVRGLTALFKAIERRKADAAAKPKTSRTAKTKAKPKPKVKAKAAVKSV